jgi:hypothetical protein
MSNSANSLNIKSAGIPVFDGTATFTETTTTQYNVLVGAASNAIANVAPSATSGVPLISGGSSANPSFGTAVVAGGGTGNTTFTAYSVICAGTTATGAFQNVSGVGTAGQVLTSAGASALPTWSNPVDNLWSVITVNQTAAVNNGYICNKAGLLTLLLPTTAAVGTIIEVTGMNTALGWTVTQNASQQIFIGTSSTTSGTGGSLSSSNIYDSVKLVCNVANTSWIAVSFVGNLTVV